MLPMPWYVLEGLRGWCESREYRLATLVILRGAGEEPRATSLIAGQCMS